MGATANNVPAGRDRWSLKAAWGPLLVMSGLGASLWYDSDLLFVISFLLALAFIIIRGFGVVFALNKGRYRRAASLLTGLCIIILSLWASPHVGELILRFRLPEFEKLVAQQRSRIGYNQPVRMVVFADDHSAFVTSNNFEQIIFDETDKIDHYPDNLEGFWPYPGSSTGLIDVGWGQKSIKRISGHFYRVTSTDP